MCRVGRRFDRSCRDFVEGNQAVTDITVTPAPRPRMRREDRPSITLPNGRRLEPRVKFADEVGLSERTVTRMNLPTTYIGCVAYVDRAAGLNKIGADVKRRNNEPARRRKASAHRGRDSARQKAASAAPLKE
jgi:hypothetical protein